MRAIYIPGIEKWVSLGDYVQAIKTARANPDAEFRHGLSCWWPCSGREIVRQFAAGMNDRINQGIRYMDRGK